MPAAYALPGDVEFIPLLLYAIAFLCVAAAAILLVYHFPRLIAYISRRTQKVTETKRDDAVEMAVFYQNMRDLFEEQKKLARDLNRSVDNKVAYIRKTVRVAEEDIRRVKSSVAEISGLMAQVRSTLEELRNANQKQETFQETSSSLQEPANTSNSAQSTPLEDDMPKAENSELRIEPLESQAHTTDWAISRKTDISPTPPRKTSVVPAYSPSPPSTSESAPASDEIEKEFKPSPAFRAPQWESFEATEDTSTPITLPESDDAADEAPDPFGPDDDLMDTWVGLSDHETPVEHPFPVPDEPPASPADADAARQAFRALLDMDFSSVDEHKPELKPDTSPPPTVKRGGNGKKQPVTPVQARVYAYNDAGMTIAQISQELGIGKGEVRLILSLRKERGD